MTLNKLAAIIHELVQGEGEWDYFRLTHYGASEAAVMLGLSKNATRTELLRMKYLGDAKEFGRWVQENILNHGHVVEALARPITESEIDDDLYAVTCSAPLMPAWANFEMSASCDGLTPSRKIAWEHKQWNEELAASVRAGILPDAFMPQPQQIMMVTRAEKVIFTVSDGTEEKRVSMEVFPDPVWQERILAGWCQFDKDLAAYSLPEAEKILAAEPVLALPAVSVQVTGKIAVVQNFNVFEVALRSFLQNDLIREPKTDQDFVDLDLQIKQMVKAEEALDAAEAQMLAQIQSVDEAKRQKDLLRELVRTNRLMAEKLFESEKKRRRDEMIESTRKAFVAHISDLQKEIIGLVLTVGTPDFAGAIKGLKSISSMKDKLDTALANGKAAADTLASDLRAKLKWVDENVADYRALLADLQQLSVKPMDDFTLAITARVESHKRAEDEKREEERARIAEEERVKAEATAADKYKAEQAVIAAQQNTEASDLLAEQKACAIASGADPVAVNQAESMLDIVKETAPVLAAILSEAPRAASPTPESIGAPTLTLGKIGTRLGFSLTADFLRSIGFEAVGRERAAMLYHESSFPLICDRLVEHINRARTPQQEAA